MTGAVLLVTGIVIVVATSIAFLVSSISSLITSKVRTKDMFVIVGLFVIGLVIILVGNNISNREFEKEFGCHPDQAKTGTCIYEQA